MPRRIVDISVALKAGIVSDPPYMLPQINYLDHTAGAQNFMQVFGVKREQLPDGAGPAVENVAISTHNGTHLDAPYHFHPTMDNGKPAMTIDQVPLEWCFNDGVKLDFLDKADGHVCTADDMKRALDRIGYQLKPLDIVLVNTTAGKAYGQPDFIDRGFPVGKSFGSKYVEFAATPGSRVKLGLYGRRALAKDAGVAPDGTGSHRIVIGGDAGSFTDPDGFAWQAASA